MAKKNSYERQTHGGKGDRLIGSHKQYSGRFKEIKGFGKKEEKSGRK